MNTTFKSFLTECIIHPREGDAHLDAYDFRDYLPEVSYTTWEIYEEECRYRELIEHVNETSHNS